MANVKISQLPATTQANATDIIEKTTDPSGSPVSEKMMLAQIATFLETAFSTLRVASSAFIIDASGNVTLGPGIDAVHLNQTGSASFAGGAISFGADGTVTFTSNGTVFSPDGSCVIGAVGHAGLSVAADGSLLVRLGGLTPVQVTDNINGTITYLYTQDGVLFSSVSGSSNQTVNADEWNLKSGKILITGIDGKSTGQTTLYTVPAGKSLVVERIVVIPTTVTGFTVAAAVRAGTSGGSYADVVSLTTLTGLNAITKSTSLSPIAAATVIPAAGTLKLDIATGATATTYTLEVVVIGFLI